MNDSIKRRTGETVEDFVERAVLSRRRAVIFIFFIGLLVVTAMFFIRIDIDAENNCLGKTMRLVGKTSPVFLTTIRTILAYEKEKETRGNGGRPTRFGDDIESEASYLQRHPKDLLKKLFGKMQDA